MAVTGIESRINAMATAVTITKQEFEDFILQQGFEQIKLAGTYELVYGKRVDAYGLKMSIRVYSSIDIRGATRPVGSDAIRVQIWAKIPDLQGERIVAVSHAERVHRVQGWRSNLQYRLNRWNLLIGPPCPKCGLPTVRRDGKGGRKFWGCSQYPRCEGKISSSW